MKARAGTFGLGPLVGLALFCLPRPVLADATAAQRATAEALFQQAAQLMDQKHFNEACEKFAASQELDPGLGTTLYLADCYEQAGKTASAWALFEEAIDGAHRAQQNDREQIATERAANLNARLSKLELRVPVARQVAGLQLRINNMPVPIASWNLPMPVDPGPTRIEAQAPGKKPWVLQFKVAEGPSTQVVEVAELSDAPRPRPSVTSTQVNEPAPQDKETNTTQRTIGYVVGAVGVVGVVVGGVFGYRALTLNRRSKTNCRAEDPNACTPDGASERKDAQSAGTLSTVASIGGGALLVTGLTLVLTAPSSAPARAGAQAPTQAAWPGLGLQVRGVW